MSRSPEIVLLSPDPGTVTPIANISGLPLNFAGGVNFFAFAADLRLHLTGTQSIPKPFIVNTFNFMLGVQLTNGGGAAAGLPAPGSMSASTSLATVQNGVVAALNGLSLTQFNSQIALPWGTTAQFEFQGSYQPPVPLAIDLVSPWPVMHVILGVALPLPVIGASAVAGSNVAQPQIITPASGAFTTGLQLIGNTE